MGDHVVRLALNMNRTLIETRCELSDLEIAGFASYEAMMPWIRRIEIDRDARIAVRPEHKSIIRAISSFNHAGPTFTARLGAITARPSRSANPAIHLIIPDGTQIICGNQLLSRTTRDHWSAHRHHDIPPAATTISAARGLAVMKLTLATLIAALLPGKSILTADLPEPELLLRAARSLAPTNASWPQSPHDAWHATHLAEIVAIAKGWIIENPCQPDGPAWKPGPNWREAVNTLPEQAIAYGHRLLAVTLDTSDELLETISFVTSEEIGTRYLAQRNFGASGEPSAHDRLYAAPIIETIDAISDELSTDYGVKSWFLQGL